MILIITSYNIILLTALELGLTSNGNFLQDSVIQA